MSLEAFFEQTNDDQVKVLIRQRRAQMLVHSCIYYELDSNIVSDHRWQRWADQLEKLQTDNPQCCNISFFDNEFRNWDGSTGNHLPHRNPWVLRKANYIMDLHRKLHDADYVIP